MNEPIVVDAELLHLERQIRRLERGELDPELFKKVRLQYGVYSMRRSPSSYMIRVRVPLGVLTPSQLDTVADLCERHTPSQACHVTTRQALQFYGVERGRVAAFLRAAAAGGLTSREASGNVVRNVTCCPWAGVSPEEPFDVTPYAQALNDYLLRNPLTQLLPRKVKIAVEGCATDHVRAAIHDIGLVAARDSGQPGFRVLVGGGLGPVPRAGTLLEPWTGAAMLLPTVEAVLRVFERCGHRDSRARARLKFLIEELGREEFNRRVLHERRLVWATQSGRMLSAMARCRQDAAAARPSGDHPELPRLDAAFAGWAATNVAPQRQPGAVSVIVRAPCGDLAAGQWRGLARVAEEHADGIRLMNTQNVLLRGVPRDRVAQVYHRLVGLQASHPWAGRLADVTRCPGADTCLSAITHPRGLAQAVDALCHNGLSRWADAPIALKFSGCPNACGQHHIADLGGFGVAVKVGQWHLPCYQLLVGGGTDGLGARFGQRLARVPARRVPEAITRLVMLYGQQRQGEESFAAFVQRVGLEPLQVCLADLLDVSRAVSDPELFKDLGEDQPFVLEAGKGECAE